ncbi:hypothetical protein TanjilG_31392 [Lupinus angustifolius]|uniref:Uncharacterized protein n=1 Tax=Lupinus angustifolius TaxID=3871 RepID=A0A394DMQ6_LUPAN|nr:hypothetical protein TanjilG_31392 [Lupinus angustifolius]
MTEETPSSMTMTEETPSSMILDSDRVLTGSPRPMTKPNTSHLTGTLKQLIKPMAKTESGHKPTYDQDRSMP